MKPIQVFTLLPLIMGLFLMSGNLVGQPILTSESPIAYSAEARIRNGKTGFEAVLFTPSTPLPGQPGGAQFQLDPAGAPVWNSNGNVYGDQHSFLVEYDYLSGTIALSVDFNRDGDFLDNEESAVSVTSSLTGKAFTYLNFFLQGATTNGLCVQVTNLSVNGYALGNYQSCSDTALNLVFRETSGFFTQVQVSGELLLTGGASQEIPRFWIRFGDVADPCSSEPIPLQPAVLKAECQATVSEAPLAITGCGDTLTGITTDPLIYTYPGNFNIHWTFDDGQGHQSGCVQQVIVYDSLAPIPNIPVLSEITGTVPFALTQYPVATDQCMGTIVATTGSPLEYSLPGTYQVIWTFTDNSGNLTSQLQTILLSPAITPCPEDLNGDRYINVSDYIILVGSFGLPCESCPSDFNGDDQVDVQDYMQLVALFDTPCQP